MFDKHTAKFCQSLERYLNMKSKVNETTLQEVLISLVILFHSAYAYKKTPVGTHVNAEIERDRERERERERERGREGERERERGGW